MAGASLYDFRDLDLMMRLEEESRMTSGELAEAVGLTNGGARHMGIRLAWMKKFGFVEFDEKEHAWALSPGGERVTAAHLSKAKQRALTGVPDEALVEVMAHVAARYRMGDPLVAKMLSREFLFGTQKR